MSKKYPDFYPRTVGDLKRELANLPDDMPVIFLDCEPLSGVGVQDGQLVLSDPLSDPDIQAEIEEEEADGSVTEEDIPPEKFAQIEARLREAPGNLLPESEELIVGKTYWVFDHDGVEWVSTPLLSISRDPNFPESILSFQKVGAQYSVGIPYSARLEYVRNSC